jgi:hypothetical protein
MFELINKGFDALKSVISKITGNSAVENLKTVTLKATGTKDLNMNTSAQTPSEARAERVKAATHTFLLNRKDRRFLKSILGEDYPVGSKTSAELFCRVRRLQTLGISKESLRAVAPQFLMTGRV